LLTKKLTFDSVIYSFIIDTIGEKNRLNTLFKGKPVLIDCWASWCGPCVAEMPYSKEVEKKYSDRIDFIYLSFDKNNFSWRKKMRVLGLEKNSFLLDKNFTSSFAKYFNINSIPRYILIDKYGKISSANALRPSDKNLIDQLEKLL
jgi:thiol-disulfide isomerase/thioredoxin